MSYTSREGYAAPLTQPNARGPDPRAASLVSDTLARGMAEVSARYTNLWAQAESAAQVNEATGIAAAKSMELADMQRGFDADPNPATAHQRFRERAAEWRAASLEGLKPGVAAHVGRQLDAMIPGAYRQVSAAAWQRNLGNLRAGMDTTLDTHGQGIGEARDEAQLLAHVQGIKQTVAGNVAAGVINEGDARALFSRAMARAVTIRAAADPLAAQALLDRFKGEMDAGAVATLTTSLRAPVERAQVEGVASEAITLSADTNSRAQAVIAGLVARGLPQHVAVGLAANAVQESGARPDPGLGDGGMSSGLFQWNRDRRAAFKAQFGRDPHEATLDQQLDFAVAELRGTEKRAGDALMASTTAEQAAKLASTLYLRPRDTAVEETRRAGIAARLSGARGPRDAAIEHVRDRLRDAPLHMRLSAESMVDQHFSRLEANNQQARALLTQDVRDLAAAYDAGNTRAEIPEARIRALMPDAADRVIAELGLARSTGDAVAAVAFVSPADELATRTRLAGDPSDTYMAGERQKAVAAYDAAIDRKRRAAFADPMNYAASAPEVAELRRQNAPLAQIVAASLEVQARIGIPAHKQRILDNGQVESIAATLRSTGPEKADMAATLSQVAGQFGGELWNRAYGELVQHGKIGWEWQAMAGMTDPAQAQGRAQLQQALVFMAERGGPEALRKLIDPAKTREIAPAVEDQMAPFREATRLHPGGSGLFATMRQAVETLTEWRIYRGQDASAAAKAAYQDVIGARWDTAGDDGSGMFGGSPTLLVPKGRAGAIETGLDQVRGAITAGDLAPLADPLRAGASPDELRAATLSAARRGLWINNQDGSGAVLKGRGPNGMMVDILRADGRPIEVDFDRLSAPGQIAAALRRAPTEEPAPTGGLTGPAPAGTRPSFLEIMSRRGTDPWTLASDFVVDSLFPPGSRPPALRQGSEMPASTVTAPDRPREATPMWRGIPSWSERQQRLRPPRQAIPTEGDR